MSKRNKCVIIHFKVNPSVVNLLALKKSCLGVGGRLVNAFVGAVVDVVGGVVKRPCEPELKFYFS